MSGKHGDYPCDHVRSGTWAQPAAPLVQTMPPLLWQSAELLVTHVMNGLLPRQPAP
jgi:hypothetical protein